MTQPSDQDLLRALQQRFEEKREALQEVERLNRDLSRINARLLESEELKTRFLSNVRNEFNNPLAAILGLARQLGNSPGDRDKAALIAEMIYAEAFNLDFQLQNICVAAEIEAGEAPPSYARVEIAGLVEGVLEAFRHQAARRRIDLKKIVPDSLLFVSDAQKLHIVLSNLVANALEFGVDGEPVTVKAGCGTGGGLKIEVHNAGSRISGAEQECAFDRFRQLDEGSSKPHRGHGLGLSVTRSLVELLGGEIVLGGGVMGGFQVFVSLPQPESEAGLDVVAQTGNLFLFGETERF